MANVTVTKGGGPSDILDNQPGVGVQDYHDGRREYKPAADRDDWRVVLARLLGLGALLVVLWALYGLWKLAYCWGGENYGACATINAAEPLVWPVGLLVGICAALVHLHNAHALGQARAIRTATTYTRWGDPVRLDVGIGPADMQMYAMATALKERTAPHEALHSINTYSPTYQQPKDTAPALPAPPPGLQLVGDAEWRSWLLEAPHLLISGPSGAGKTTLATALLGDASERGAGLLLLDPHDAAGKWPIPAIGGGRDYDGIYGALDGLMREMNVRFEALRAGETTFRPVVVLLDEAPAVALHDLKRWQGLVSRLTSEARKIGLTFWLLGQSHLVRDLGLSSLVRRNLGLVALGPQALDLVAEERDAARRRQLQELLRGQGRPAAFSYRTEVHALDVAAVPVLAARAFTPLAWRPSVPDPDDAGFDGDRGDGPHVGRGDEGRLDADLMRETLVVSLKRTGRTREEIRQALNEMGLGLRNGEYSAILARHGLS